MGAAFALSDLLHEMLHDKSGVQSKEFYRRPEVGNAGISINVTYVSVVSSDTRSHPPGVDSIERPEVRQALDALLRSLDLPAATETRAIRQLKTPRRFWRPAKTPLGAA